jgi:hypothetical protein
MSKTKTPNTKQAIIEVLTSAPEATAAQIAVSAGVGRSTAGKMLAQLESDGDVRRTEGGREGNRRLPLWSLVGKQPANAAGDGKSAKAPAAEKPAGGKDEPTPSASEADDGKLKPGGLDPLVLGFPQRQQGQRHGPTQVAKTLQMAVPRPAARHSHPRGGNAPAAQKARHPRPRLPQRRRAAARQDPARRDPRRPTRRRRDHR